MVETAALQQTTNYETRYPVRFNLHPFKEQLHEQNQQLHVTEDPNLASAASPLSALTANSAQAKRPPASTCRRRCRRPLLALHNDRPSKPTRARNASTLHTVSSPEGEHDYYSQRLNLTSNIPSVDGHKFNAYDLIFSESLSPATRITTLTDDNADANAENPASLSTAAIRQRSPTPPPSRLPPSIPTPLLQQQAEPVTSPWQPYSRPASIIHHYQAQSISSVPNNVNLSPYRYPNTTAQPRPVPQLASSPEQQLHYTEQQTIPYNNPTPNQYPPTDTSELMAAAHMQRPPFSQPMYHAPQSSSSAGVVSQHNHHDYSRIYASQTAQLNQPMQYNGYNTSMNQLPSYGHQGHTQGHINGASSLLMSHHPNPLSPLGHSSANTSVLSHSPARQELDMPMQRIMDASRPPSSLADHNNSIGGMHHPPSSSGSGGGGSGGGSTGTASAPGPIPATTPLVVRQEGAVQWIAFEYSKDRVKMEYTMRCDVESVDIEKLDSKFKLENCVYPRANTPKADYKGNRFAYESECNNVGWGLAHLNACLRGKRGLIQRAVDSWRNSNSDPRVRSRRVRRLAKADKRREDVVGNGTGNAQARHPEQPRGIPQSPPMAMSMSRGYPGMMTGQHHHRLNAHSDGSITGGAENVSEASPNDDIRQSHVFHEYPTYMNQQAAYATAAVPPPHNVFRTLGSNVVHAATSPMVTTAAKVNVKTEFEEPEDKLIELYGDIPRDKYRKFILVRDEQRKDYKDGKDGKDGRSRIRVQLGKVNLEDIPDSYCRANSVYPRVYYSRQFPDDGHPKNARLIGDDETDIDGNTSETCISSTLVPISLLNGEKLALPRISRSKRHRENALNEIGYRMLWSNHNTFPGRHMFMQKCLDLYRKKTREAIETHGVQHSNGTINAQHNEATTIPPQFRLRIGRQKWEARRGRAASMVDR